MVFTFLKGLRKTKQRRRWDRDKSGRKARSPHSLALYKKQPAALVSPSNATAPPRPLPTPLPLRVSFRRSAQDAGRRTGALWPQRGVAQTLLEDPWRCPPPPRAVTADSGLPISRRGARAWLPSWARGRGPFPARGSCPRLGLVSLARRTPVFNVLEISLPG